MISVQCVQVPRDFDTICPIPLSVWIAIARNKSVAANSLRCLPSHQHEFARICMNSSWSKRICLRMSESRYRWVHLYVNQSQEKRASEAWWGSGNSAQEIWINQEPLNQSKDQRINSTICKSAWEWTNQCDNVTSNNNVDVATLWSVNQCINKQIQPEIKKWRCKWPKQYANK
jgi:hypothetical protein